MDGAMETLAKLAPTITMLAVFALVFGGIRLVRAGDDSRTKGVLMLVCAAVLVGNVLIWTL
ncbi:hypothetical protein ASE86_07075 [Sphingomonas sp. Leaf33]|uniref:hypothetical protein n=1 Tax=Sphingomonas sp. Leaf33 TaxID=1736215 RepID=UPI0006F60C73|nr:hypothetical protein [Sphingomonas sp. Leaf33]KQN26898.1 hypothetical protein ASE86_07075 [Sphingomonas sp. Leaf33]